MMKRRKRHVVLGHAADVHDDKAGKLLALVGKEIQSINLHVCRRAYGHILAASSGLAKADAHITSGNQQARLISQQRELRESLTRMEDVFQNKCVVNP
jgi:hypothetical protein